LRQPVGQTRISNQFEFRFEGFLITVGAFEAKTCLSTLPDRAMAGDE